MNILMEEWDYTHTAVVVTKVSLCANCTLNAYLTIQLYSDPSLPLYDHYIALFRYDFTTM